MSTYIKNFKNYNEYKEYINSDSAVTPCVSIIEDDGNVFYTNLRYGYKQGEFYTADEGVICFSNGSDYQFIKTNEMEDFYKDNALNSLGYKPIGVLVIPANISAKIYPKDHPNKECNIIMSLVPMSCKTPNVGGNSNEEIYWGAKQHS